MPSSTPLSPPRARTPYNPAAISRLHNASACLAAGATTLIAADYNSRSPQRTSLPKPGGSLAALAHSSIVQPGKLCQCPVCLSSVSCPEGVCPAGQMRLTHVRLLVPAPPTKPRTGVSRMSSVVARNQMESGGRGDLSYRLTLR